MPKLNKRRQQLRSIYVKRVKTGSQDGDDNDDDNDEDEYIDDEDINDDGNTPNATDSCAVNTVDSEVTTAISATAAVTTTAITNAAAAIPSPIKDSSITPVTGVVAVGVVSNEPVQSQPRHYTRHKDKVQQTSASTDDSKGGGKNTNDDKSKTKDAVDDDRVWVQCNSCDKWRALPSTVDSNSLPKLWFCSQNVYDPTHNTCDALEEKYNNDYKLQSFFKIWLKRIKSADRAESKLTSAAATRGRRKKGDVEWIKCCNPSCGKWRAISPRGLDTMAICKKLNYRKSMAQWVCAMNSWDETTASCSAPQEPIYDVEWNINS